MAISDCTLELESSCPEILLGVAALHSEAWQQPATGDWCCLQQRCTQAESRKPSFVFPAEQISWKLESRRADLSGRQVDLRDVHAAPPKWRGVAPQYQGEKPRGTPPFLTALSIRRRHLFSELCLDRSPKNTRGSHRLQQRVMASSTKCSSFPGLCMS
jgi:hypothetical protein